MNHATICPPCHPRTFHPPPKKTKAVCAVVAHTAFALPGAYRPARRCWRLTWSASASSSRIIISGQEIPCSHFETACEVTQQRCASSFCVRPASCRRDAMRQANRSMSINSSNLLISKPAPAGAGTKYKKGHPNLSDVPRKPKGFYLPGIELLLLSSRHP